MARIRSVHPGLFTDEAFAVLSCDAQIFLVGLWTEADDQGIFEWKPATLRMRLRAAKDGSVDGILAELEEHDCVKSYELKGKKYGAIRNFRKFQRPKSPNSTHPITVEIGNYTMLTATNSEMEEVEENQFPQNGEIHPQREDGGDKMEDEGGSKVVPQTPKPDFAEIQTSWNAMAKQFGLAAIQSFTDERKTKATQRLHECGGLTGWYSAMEKIGKSSFLKGGGRDGWRADFDFVMQKKSFTKLMEGGYDDRKSGGSGHKSTFELINETLPRGDG